MRAVARLAVIAATAGCLGGLALPAFAGSYVVGGCSPSSSPGAWVETNTGPDGLTVGQTCGGPPVGPAAGGDQGALYSEDILNSLAAIPDGAQAGWTFIAPPGTTITAISYYRALASFQESDLIAGLFQASGAPLEQCMIGLASGSSIVCSMPNNEAPLKFSGMSTSSLFFGVACHVVTVPGAFCHAGGTIHAAQADLYSASVTLSQTAPPTIAQPGGGLWGGGVVSGVVPVTFAASDPSGIRQDLVRSEAGQTLTAVSQPCDFTTTQPCPQLPAGLLNADTTRVPDGPQTFSLVVTDAAGNTQTVSSPTVTVDNDGPPAPTGFRATAQGGASNAIDLSWVNPGGPPAPITAAMVQLCQVACAAPVGVPSIGGARITAPGPGAYTLRLWLLDAQGRGGPQSAAHTSVTIPIPGGAAGNSPGQSSRISASLAGRRLHVSGTIPAAHGTVEIGWRSRRSGRTLGRGSRVSPIRRHRIDVTFTLGARAVTGTIRVTVRAGRRIVARVGVATPRRLTRNAQRRCAAAADHPCAARTTNSERR